MSLSGVAFPEPAPSYGLPARTERETSPVPARGTARSRQQAKRPVYIDEQVSASASAASSTTARASYPRNARTRPSPAPTAASASSSLTTRSRRSRNSAGQSQNGLSPEKISQITNGGLSASSTPPPQPVPTQTYSRKSISAASDDTTSIPEVADKDVKKRRITASSSNYKQVVAVDGEKEVEKGERASGLESRQVSNGSSTPAQPRIRLTFGMRRVAVREGEPVKKLAGGLGNETRADGEDQTGSVDDGDNSEEEEEEEEEEVMARSEDEYGVEKQSSGERPELENGSTRDLAEVVLRAHKPKPLVHITGTEHPSPMGESNVDAVRSNGEAPGDITEAHVPSRSTSPDAPLFHDTNVRSTYEDRADGGPSTKRQRTTLSPLTEPDDERLDTETLSDKAAKALALKESRRAPRKKRKWLKKGQIDPDDEAAVARQRERHTMIDQALEDLDRQYEMAENGTHAQLIEMLDELEKRRDLQLERLDARYQATRSELAVTANREDRGHMEEWQTKILAMQDAVSSEIETKIRLVDMEKNMFKRQAGDFTLVRSGWGGGGWMTYDKHLMSKKNLPLVPTFLNGAVRQRRDISIRPSMLDPDSIADDLAIYGVRQPKPRAYGADDPAGGSGGGSGPPPRKDGDVKPPRTGGETSTSSRPSASAPIPPAPTQNRDSSQSSRPTQNHAPPPRSVNREPPPPAPVRIYDVPYDGYDHRDRDRDEHGRVIPPGHPRPNPPTRAPNSVGNTGYMRPPAVPNPTPFSRPTSIIGSRVPDEMQRFYAEADGLRPQPSMNSAPSPFLRPSSNGSSASPHPQPHPHANGNGTNSNSSSSDRQPTHAPAGARWGFSAHPPRPSSSTHDSSHSRPSPAFATGPVPSFGSASTLGRPVVKLGTNPIPPSHPLPPAGPRSSTVIAGWHGDDRHWNGVRMPQSASSVAAPAQMSSSSSSTSAPAAPALAPAHVTAPAPVIAAAASTHDSRSAADSGGRAIETPSTSTSGDARGPAGATAP